MIPAVNLPDPPRPDLTGPPPSPPSRPIWKRWWFWVGVVVVIGAVGSAVGGGTSETGDGETTLQCVQPSTAWLDTLQSAFYQEFRSEPITSSWYVEADTSEGTAYYVAVTVEGVSGVAVFGTSDPPRQADPGLIAGANATAHQLSDLGIDIPEDSSAGALLLDDDATSAAESCI
jgi:hypothetical protein